MRREDLEHLIRAAGAISGSRQLIIIGSQSILGQFPDGAPARAMLSMEADLIPLDALDKVDLLTGSIGELSPFHETFGYYGDGVSMQTACLPEGWQQRLVPIDNASTRGYVGLCLEVHDLLISKYVAGRDKDHEFCAAVVQAGLVDQQQLYTRLEQTDLADATRERIRQRIVSSFALERPTQ